MLEELKALETAARGSKAMILSSFFSRGEEMMRVLATN